MRSKTSFLCIAGLASIVAIVTGNILPIIISTDKIPVYLIVPCVIITLGLSLLIINFLINKMFSSLTKKKSRKGKKQ